MLALKNNWLISLIGLIDLIGFGLIASSTSLASAALLAYQLIGHFAIFLGYVAIVSSLATATNAAITKYHGSPSKLQQL
jgi:hypothetical protein